MSLVKQKGNMYTWVTHCHTHLGGICPHECAYCYVQKGVAKLSGKYAGPPRLIEKELKVNYGKGKTIFIEHMNDFCAEGIPDEWITKILNHCGEYPSNTYVFQTKNPERCVSHMSEFPSRHCLGTTIETNNGMLLKKYSKAPSPLRRATAMSNLKDMGFQTFATIEPIMDFEVFDMVYLIDMIDPLFVNIGADSKHNNLPEPSAEKIEELLKELKYSGIEVREKHNLDRLLGIVKDENDTTR